MDSQRGPQHATIHKFKFKLRCDVTVDWPVASGDTDRSIVDLNRSVTVYKLCVSRLVKQ